MQAASTSPASQGARRVALAADVVAVQAHADVEAPDREVLPGSKPPIPQE